METGYPSTILYVILGIGIPLAFTRPYFAFLLVTFMLSAADTLAFTFTRTPLLGPYFNANDACLLIAMIAAITSLSKLGYKLYFPQISKLIIAVLLIGFLQSCFIMDEINYDVLRSFRWALNLPVYIIIAATMVNNEDKLRQLLIAVFFGSILSAIQHLIFVQTRLELTDNNLDIIRTISYRSPGIWFLLAAILHFPRIKGINRYIILGGMCLFSISTLLNQTRSIWISSIITFVPVMFLYFKQKNLVIKTMIITGTSLIVCILVAFIMWYTTPGLNPKTIITKRFFALKENSGHTATRKLSFEREMVEWSKGTIVLGRGLVYYLPYYSDLYKGSRVAWGHLGHITILAQLGLVGLIIYSFYLPLTVIKASIKLWENQSENIKFFGLLTGIGMISSWFCFFMSDSYLSQHAFDGIVFGAAWRITTLLQKSNSNKAIKQIQ